MTKKIPIILFGNEKLATGVKGNQYIKDALEHSELFEIEQVITGSIKDLRAHKSKLAVLAAFGKIIPQSILDEFPLGIINVHPSLLPQYRGPTPIEQAILDGCTKTGVSIMKLTAGMDEGPIFKQKSIHLNGSESKQMLTDTLHHLGTQLLMEILPEINKGLKPRKQPHPDRASYSKKINKKDGEIDFNKNAEDIEREIRAYSGWPQSRTNLANIDVIITKASVIKTDDNKDRYSVNGKKLYLHFNENSLLIEKLKPVGKSEMTAEAFLAGYGSRIN